MSESSTRPLVLTADFRKPVVREGPHWFSVLQVDNIVQKLFTKEEVFFAHLTLL